VAARLRATALLYKLLGMDAVPSALASIRARTGLSQEALARVLGVSYVSVNRWERGASRPSPAVEQRILALHEKPESIASLVGNGEAERGVFASRGARIRAVGPLFTPKEPRISLADEPMEAVLSRLAPGPGPRRFGADISDLLDAHRSAAAIASAPPTGGLSAGKNTYTYDAHTYHTKVPPQGIAELLKHYLPDGGLVLDIFGGSGMTAVASLATGHDCILNELSPAACFIASQFTARVDPVAFSAAVKRVMEEVADVRRRLYATNCRECGRSVEAQYFVWSYIVGCSECGEKFTVWDHSREYGERVRDHKILKEFPCPSCKRVISKSRLKRFTAEPVLVGYKCCGSRQTEVTHAPSKEDLAAILAMEYDAGAAEGFVPQVPIPDGMNLNQPKRHGLTTLASFYSPRNLAAMSHIWRAIHRVEDDQLAGALAFVFTSLYQRVTRMSEFRFWGGSGNTPRFNVPHIFNESNVFLSFERKARTIQDHLETTATHYDARCAVVNGSATDLGWLPSGSVDLVFTDPPFGGNINYSEMNILWEGWLGAFTDNTHEAIINKFQRKDVSVYGNLMTRALAEAHRVLRPEGWLILVFMDSSAGVWSAFKYAISDAGFEIAQVDIFDKQHGTFKHHVSENTAGCDLVLHCRKRGGARLEAQEGAPLAALDSVRAFIASKAMENYRTTYLHVRREEETDTRLLYSEWLAERLLLSAETLDFPTFRDVALRALEARQLK
jgi:DNA modification methylase/transcriptional regulator with XRE-family HTH domain